MLPPPPPFSGTANAPLPPPLLPNALDIGPIKRERERGKGGEAVGDTQQEALLQLLPRCDM